MAERYALLRRQYTEQSQRAQLHFADSRIKQPSCAALFHLAVDSVKASRLVYAALREADSAVRTSDMHLVPPEVVGRAIDWNGRRLDRLEGQLRLLDLVDGIMLPLRKLFGQLEGSRHSSALGWRSIVRHVMSEVGRRADVASVLPLPGFSLKAYLSLAGHGPYGDAFARGIETVVALAAVLPQGEADAHQTELVALAGLCQNCGLPLLARCRGTSGKAEGADIHAAMGAALVAGMTEFAAELPSLISEHHRRFISFDRIPDGIPPLQSRRSRLLATTVRFLEIVDELAVHAAGELPQPALYPVALRLNHEASRGEWDREVTASLLTALGFQLKQEGIEESRGEFDRGESGLASRRLDPADASIPEPNFHLAHEAREGRHVAINRW